MNDTLNAKAQSTTPFTADKTFSLQLLVKQGANVLGHSLKWQFVRMNILPETLL